MKRSVLFTLCLLILLAAPIHAQEPTPAAPWPPDPSPIFADGVTWEEVQPASPAAQPAPDVVNDFERHVIRVRDEATGTWQEFPYPPSIVNVDGANLRSDGMVWLLLDWEASNDPRPDDFILLDPATGEYSPPPTVCDGRVIQAEPGEGQWVAAYAPGTSDHATLCHSETGEQRDILPVEMEGWRTWTSPDDVWLVLLGVDLKQLQFLIYAYPLAGGNPTLLGAEEWGMDQSYWLCGWVSAEKGVICGSDPYHSWVPVSYQAFDVTQANSLEHLFSGWDNVFFDEEHAQYVALRSERYAAYHTNSLGSGRPCTLYIFNADGLHQFDLNFECRVVAPDLSGGDFVLGDYRLFYRQDNMLYFLTIDSEEATIAELRSYNLALDPSAPSQTEVLFEGEIETIWGVSPDGRYIVLITNDNLQFDLNPNWIYRPMGWQITIVDRTQEVWDLRYQSEPMSPGLTIWLDDHTVVILSGEVTTSRRIGEHELDRVPVTQPATIRRITLNDDGSYDMWLRTLDHAVFLRDALPAGYRMTIDAWEDDNTVRLTLRQGDDSVTYRLDLSALWTSLQEN